MGIYRDRGLAIHSDAEKWDTDEVEDSVELVDNRPAYLIEEDRIRAERAAGHLGEEKRSGKQNRLVAGVRKLLSKL